MPEGLGEAPASPAPTLSPEVAVLLRCYLDGDLTPRQFSVGLDAVASGRVTL